MPPELSPLPVRVRPVPFETVASYAARLAAANWMPSRPWRAGLNAIARSGSGDSAIVKTIEELGGLRAGHFAREHASLPIHPDGGACDKCTTGLVGRFGCARCTAGEEATQTKHDGPRVCGRHRRWIGPGTQPDEQVQVGPAVLVADRKYQRLRRRGLVDAHLLAEILGCVDHWAEQEPARAIHAAERFRVAVDIAAQVFVAATLEQLRSRAMPAELRYAKVAGIVQGIVCGLPSILLVDAVWLFMRTIDASGMLHSAPAAIERDCVDSSDDLVVVRSCSYPRERERHLTQCVTSAGSRTRFAPARGIIENQYLCPLGHRFENSIAVIRRLRRSDGCAYCARRLPLAGFNTLADTHPEIARQWHPELNGALTADQVLSGSTVVVKWLCDLGHTFKNVPSNRVSLGAGCGYCANLVLLPSFNSLAARNPELVAEWHPTRNGATGPSAVLCGSKTLYWWLCPEGHSYRASPVRRRNGSGCRKCTRRNRRECGPKTSLAATHPEIAARWHPTKNGELRPEDVLSGSGRRVWWQCEAGHDREQLVNNRVRTLVTCVECAVQPRSEEESMLRTHPQLAAELHPYRNGTLTARTSVAATPMVLWWRCECGNEWRTSGNRRITGRGRCAQCRNRLIVPGKNDMATTHPALAREMHPTKNGDLDPSCVVAGTSKSLTWQCSEGHVWGATGGQRVAGRGCPRCQGMRVVKGYNDMATTHPVMAMDWDYQNNGTSSPTRVLARTTKQIHWVCPSGHRARENGKRRISQGGCRSCNKPG